jgi:hypothetical protein
MQILVRGSPSHKHLDMPHPDPLAAGGEGAKVANPANP